MKTKMKYTDLQKEGYINVHSATCRGYVSRKLRPEDYSIVSYSGKYGDGFKALLPNKQSTNYSIVEYWVK